MNRFRGLIHEVHRRSLWQVLAVYVVGAYLAVEVIGNLDDVFGLPEWVAPAALVLFLFGLPVVLATAFVQEGAPDRSDLTGRGEKPTLAGFESTSDTALAAPPVGFDGDHDGLADAPAAAVAAEPGSAGRPRDFLERTLTWRRAILVGIGAFLLLAVSTAGYMGLRQSGIGPWGTLLAKGVLNEDDRVLLADFSAAGEDSLMARAVTEALRVDLERSDVVRVVEPAAVQRVLALMAREPDARLDEALAREVALRDGIEGVLFGSVNRLGDARVLTARLVSARDGAVLASFRQTADDDGEVVEAVDRLSEALRERVGESIRSIRRSPPLERVTTSSLDALERYSQARRLMAVEPESRRATRLLEEAVSIDSTFAMAHLELAASYGMTGADPQQSDDALLAAYRLRDRLSDRERYVAEAHYLRLIRADDAGAAEVLRQAVDAYPEDPRLLRNYAEALAELGRFEEAERYTRASLAIDSLEAVAHDGLMFILAAQGRYDEARQALELAMRRFPADSLWHTFNRAQFAYVRGDIDEAGSLLRHLDEVAGPDQPQWAGRARHGLAELALLQGRVREANRNAAEGLRYAPFARDNLELWAAAYAASSGALLGVDSAAAIERFVELLDRADLDPTDPGSGYLQLTEITARVGLPDRAHVMLEGWRASAGDDDRARSRTTLLGVEAAIASARGDLRRSIELTHQQRAASPACMGCGLDELAEAHARLGQADSAAAYWRHFLERPALYRLESDAFDLPAAHWYLARYNDEQSADSLAARHYAAVIELWQDADPELQPRVRAARERLVALAREGR